jgi:hypothetical protein
MRERAGHLKEEVRQMFEAGGKAADTLTLVDTLERLGVDNHFRQEIDMALARVHSDEQLDGGNSHIVSLGFRLLRQHGLWVPAGICIFHEFFNYVIVSMHGYLINYRRRCKC